MSINASFFELIYLIEKGNPTCWHSVQLTLMIEFGLQKSPIG